MSHISNLFQVKASIYIFSICLLLSVCSLGQDVNKVAAEIDVKLTAGQVSVSSVLSDKNYMSLHSLTPFREIIKKHAKPGKVKIIADSEPGKKITVKGIVESSKGKPLNDLLIYVYQTSDKGWYSDSEAQISLPGGNTGHARLFGYLKTDTKGQFEFETIQPKGYPRSDFPAHIHIVFWKDGHLIDGAPGELQFDDDPRMTPERRLRSLSNGNLVEKNSGSSHKPVYFYKIVLKD